MSVPIVGEKTHTTFIHHMIPTCTYRAITRVSGHTSTAIVAIIVAAIRVFVTSIWQNFAFVDVYLKAM